jgi:hypothetical protein
MATRSKAKKQPARTSPTKRVSAPPPRAARPAAKKTPRRKATAAADSALPAAVEPSLVAASSVDQPASRRAIFIDVENTSSETELIRVLDQLEIDRRLDATEITAVGNWRVIGQQLGRMLATRGAHLVHSAPATRVRDWSDLWIAVSAGMWLGRASSGDRIDIISDDRAFDAVGDAAARLGIVYRRISCRGGHAAPAPETATATEPRGHAGGRRRRRHRGGERPSAPAHTRAAAASHPAAAAARHVAPARHDEDEPHGASQAQLRAIIARLAGPDPSRGVSLDALTLALKAEGFQRPPGSPRLVTRLRRLKDVEITSNGRVCLIGAAAEIATAESSDEAVPAAFNGESASAPPVEVDGDETATPAEAADGGHARRRTRRRGGRGRRARRNGAAPTSDSAS